MTKPLLRNMRRAALTLLCVGTLGTALAADIPSASPEEVGMSSERLERINTVMQRHMDAGNIQGAVTVVARQGKPLSSSRTSLRQLL